MDFGIRCRIARVSASASFLTADRLEDITYRFSRICIEYKFLTAGNEDNGNLVFSVTETFCKADPIVSPSIISRIRMSQLWEYSAMYF